MRDIKFRGRRTTDGQWVYGYLCPGSEINKTLYIVTYGNSWEVNPETVGQYTGLKDKNGKEIYEGDLYKSSMSFNNPKEVKWKQEWDDQECSYAGWSFDVINPAFIEIIGNIYESEILK